MIHELDRVVLTAPVPAERLECGGDEATDTMLRLKPDNAIEMSADTARCRV